MYLNYIVKVLLDNRPKTDFKYFSSFNNYRLAKICKPCGYVRDIPQHMHRISVRNRLTNANKMHTYEQLHVIYLLITVA